MKFSAHHILKPLLTCIFILSIGCSPNKSEVKNNAGDDENSQRNQMRLKQYMIQGKRLYLANCSNCHQKDGTGLGKLIPPLKDADFMMADINRAICAVKFGLSGPIVVNGVDYNQPMPGNREFTALEIAEVITYVYNTWGNKNEIIDVNKVKKVLNNCTKVEQ